MALNMTRAIQSFVQDIFPYPIISRTLSMENHPLDEGVSYFDLRAEEEKEGDFLFTKESMNDVLKSIRMSMVLSGGSHLPTLVESQYQGKMHPPDGYDVQPVDIEIKQ